jgi:hypothetical protein
MTSALAEADDSYNISIIESKRSELNQRSN